MSPAGVPEGWTLDVCGSGGRVPSRASDAGDHARGVSTRRQCAVRAAHGRKRVVDEKAAKTDEARKVPGVESGLSRPGMLSDGVRGMWRLHQGPRSEPATLTSVVSVGYAAAAVAVAVAADGSTCVAAADGRRASQAASTQQRGKDCTRRRASLAQQVGAVRAERPCWRWAGGWTRARGWTRAPGPREPQGQLPGPDARVCRHPPSSASHFASPRRLRHVGSSVRQQSALWHRTAAVRTKQGGGSGSGRSRSGSSSSSSTSRSSREAAWVEAGMQPG